MTNPLLRTHPILPAFASIRAEHAEPAIRELLEANRAELTLLLDAGADGWESLVVPLERMQHRLARAWSPVGHLNGVRNDEGLRAAYNACLPLLSAYHTELAQDSRLCSAYQRVLEREGERLAPAQRKLLENALRDFRLAGVALPPERKARFKAVMEELASTQANFDERVLDATKAWVRQVENHEQLAGLPETVIARARAAAESDGRSGWRLPLDAPNYIAVMTHAEDATLRREFHEGPSSRSHP